MPQLCLNSIIVPWAGALALWRWPSGTLRLLLLQSEVGHLLQAPCVLLLFGKQHVKH